MKRRRQWPAPPPVDYSLSDEVRNRVHPNEITVLVSEQERRGETLPPVAKLIVHSELARAELAALERAASDTAK